MTTIFWGPQNSPTSWHVRCVTSFIWHSVLVLGMPWMDTNLHRFLLIHTSASTGSDWPGPPCLTDFERLNPGHPTKDTLIFIYLRIERCIHTRTHNIYIYIMYIRTYTYKPIQDVEHDMSSNSKFLKQDHFGRTPLHNRNHTTLESCVTHLIQSPILFRLSFRASSEAIGSWVVQTLPWIQRPHGTVEAHWESRGEFQTKKYNKVKWLRHVFHINALIFTRLIFTAHGACWCMCMQFLMQPQIASTILYLLMYPGSSWLWNVAVQQHPLPFRTAEGYG